jgi:hypothetical protein
VAFWKRIEPGEARLSMHTLEMCYRMPAGAQELHVTMQLSKTLLYIDEYPPDPHRGFDITGTRVLSAVEGTQAQAVAVSCMKATKQHWLLHAVCSQKVCETFAMYTMVLHFLSCLSVKMAQRSTQQNKEGLAEYTAQDILGL